MFDRSKERPVAGHTYYAPQGGLPKQTDLMTGRAVFTQAYAVIPKGVMRDIVTSFLPFWQDTRAWVLARPLSGFAETFSQYIMEVGPGGGSDRPEPDANAEGVFFVVEGELTVTLAGKAHVLQPGGYAYFPPTSAFSVRNESTGVARFHWIRKAYEAVEGLDAPEAFVTSENDPCHGARALCARGQGGLPSQSGLGRGRGGRLHVAARLLPPGLLRGGARSVPLSAV
jgi:(S)-ureidoglycine aminohydrolase